MDEIADVEIKQEQDTLEISLEQNSLEISPEYKSDVKDLVNKIEYEYDQQDVSEFSQENVELETDVIKLKQIEKKRKKGSRNKTSASKEKRRKSGTSDSGNPQPDCVCLVCKVLQTGFSTYDFQAKLSIISAGRQTPAINLETKVDQVAKKFTRRFNTDFYARYKWLTGCCTFAKLFCWPCLLFNTSEKNSWNSSGCTDLNNFHKNVRVHVNSRGHLTALLKEKSFGKTRIEHDLNNQLKLNHRLHNELVAKNRDILKRLIDVTCFLGEHDLGRAHWEDGESLNPGNYVGLIELLAKYDEPLKTHLKDSSIFHGTSNGIQNDLVKCIADVVFDSIKKEVKETPFVSIVLDETIDITNFSRLSVVIRYVTLDGSTQERFLRFLDVTTDRTAEAMYKVVCDIVEELDCGSKLVAQSYDGASVLVGHLEGLQARVKGKFQNAMFVHCFAHGLNSVLSQGVGVIKDCKVFFATLSGIAAFFSKSFRRTRALDIQVQKRFPRVAPIGWNHSGRLVETVSQYRVALIEMFKDVLDTQDQWDPETVNSSRGYLQLLENDFKFNFLLSVFSEIFPHTDLLFDILQTKSNDIDLCVQHINAFEEELNKKLDRFQLLWLKTTNLNLEPEKNDNVRDIKMLYYQLYLQIMANISQQLKVRFKNFNELKFLELCNFKNYPFPEDAFNSLRQSYGNIFDMAALRSQLSVVYDTPEINNQKTPLNILLFLKGIGLEDSYSEVFKLAQLVLTIPATSASVERCCSTLKRIKNFVRNSTGEERSSNSALISIEKECIRDLSQNPKFYEDVIDKFANVERRIKLHYQ